jgi:saxitoxin biosynthesis operon SxtJ-like protein
MTAKAPKNPERSFGISVGLVLIAIGAALYWRGRVGRAEILAAIGVLLLAGGLIHPPVLKYPSALWWKFAQGLGYINARILLTILFTIVFVPISLIWRLSGKDPLTRRRDKWPGWTPYPPRYRDPRHYQRMF